MNYTLQEQVWFIQYNNYATGWKTGVQFPGGAGICLCHRVQIGSGAHSVPYAFGVGGFSPWVKADGA